MSATPFDSALMGKLFGDAEIGKLFSDSAAIRAMLLVEGTLAKAQAELGMIPADHAETIHRHGLEVALDPGAMADAVAGDATPVPALLAAFREAINAVEARQYVHWGATSQDIVDTALTLRLRQVLAILRARLTATTQRLGQVAETHRALPMAARTWGAVATPMSFGAAVAGWGMPLPRHLDRLSELEPRLLVVSLAGASGTLSAMGPDGAEVRAGLARGLRLGDPGGSWHSQRDRILELAHWAAGLAGSLGKMGEDMLLLARTGEVSFGGGGGSSTMPQKQNPVQAGLLVALCRQIEGQAAALAPAGHHRDQRDGPAWLLEWMILPQICIALGRALEVAEGLARDIRPAPATLRATIDDGTGLIYAEALSFALARMMPKPEAQKRVKELCLQARAEGSALPDLAQAAWPDQDFGQLFTPEAQMGDAPAEADRFAAIARAL